MPWIVVLFCVVLDIVALYRKWRLSSTPDLCLTRALALALQRRMRRTSLDRAVSQLDKAMPVQLVVVGCESRCRAEQRHPDSAAAGGDRASIKLKRPQLLHLLLSSHPRRDNALVSSTWRMAACNRQRSLLFHNPSATVWQA